MNRFPGATSAPGKMKIRLAAIDRDRERDRKMKKKKLSANVPLCTAILVIAAILAVPLLGGLKLSLAYKTATNRFEKVLTTPMLITNKDIFSDSRDVINAAETLLEKGQYMAGDSAIIAGRADKLREAIDACSGTKTGVDRFMTCEKLDSAIELYYNAFGDADRSALSTDKLRADSAYHRIKNTYRSYYDAYVQKTNSLVSGFPAEKLADFFGIGGGN